MSLFLYTLSLSIQAVGPSDGLESGLPFPAASGPWTFLLSCESVSQLHTSSGVSGHLILPVA